MVQLLKKPAIPLFCKNIMDFIANLFLFNNIYMFMFAKECIFYVFEIVVHDNILNQALFLSGTTNQSNVKKVNQRIF